MLKIIRLFFLIMEIKIYTDGACVGNPGPGGWAAIIIKEKEKKNYLVEKN